MLPTERVTLGNCGVCGHPPEVHLTEMLEIEPGDEELVEYCATCIAPHTDVAGDFALHALTKELPGG